VVLNPTAGRGRVRGAWPRVEAHLRAAGADFDLIQTTAPGGATEVAVRASDEGYDVVVAAGGDGTVQEVVNGLLTGAGNGARPALGLLPLGSGNDFAKPTGVSDADVPGAVRALMRAPVRRVDVGRMNDRYFVNGVGVGFDARVGIEAARSTRLRGLPMYGWALLKVLRDHTNPRMRVEVDGKVVADRDLTLVTVGNGGCHGGGFWLCPDACIDDGLFDICIAHGLPRRRIPFLLPAVMRGTHPRLPFVEMLRGRRVRITSDDPLPIHADGEIVTAEGHELEIEMHAGKLGLVSFGLPQCEPRSAAR